MRIERVAPERVVRATSSAAIADVGTADGRLIPIIMIDASGHPELSELIRVHEHTPAGDHVSQWATVLGNPYKVHLLLEFIRPIAAQVTIEFGLPKFSGAIDNILRAKSMYLLEGEMDSTFTSTEGRPRILMELPPTGFEDTWEQMFHKSVFKMLREKGLSQREAKRGAKRFVANWRESTTFEI